MTQTLDQILAPITNYAHLKRIAGGYQTDVYGSDNHHYVVKLKVGHGGTLREVLEHAREQREVAEQFVECLGHEHTIPNHYVVTGARRENVYVLAIQPFIAHARPLRHIDYRVLDQQHRDRIAAQLTSIMERALAFYRSTGFMPDLYGLASTSNADRQRFRTLRALPSLAWSALSQQTLLRSHNLLLHAGDSPQIVLVDYDLVHRHWLVRRAHYALRALLFWRDRWLIWRMQRNPTDQPDN